MNLLVKTHDLFLRAFEVDLPFAAELGEFVLAEFGVAEEKGGDGPASQPLGVLGEEGEELAVEKLGLELVRKRRTWRRRRRQSKGLPVRLPRGRSGRGRDPGGVGKRRT